MFPRIVMHFHMVRTIRLRMTKQPQTRTKTRVSFLVLMAAILCARSVAARPWQTPSRSGVGAPSTASGQAVFASSCASCHGLDGRGGERAPGVVGNTRVQR